LKIERSLQQFINDLEEAIGSLYYDEENISDDALRLELEDYPGIVIDIDPFLEYMSIYRSFSYYDYSRTLRENMCNIEELEEDIYKHYEQTDYANYLQQLPFDIDTQYDDCWGCPCYEVYVGLTRVPSEVKLAKDFVDLTIQFDSLSLPCNVNEYKEQRVNRILKKFGLNLSSTDFNIVERDVIDYKPIDNEQVVFYVGKESVLFKSNEMHASITKHYYNVFMEILDEVEYFSDFSVVISPTHIRFITCSYIINIIHSDYDMAVKIENLFYGTNLSNFLLFLTDENRKDLLDIVKHDNEDNLKRLLSPHIYTEGQTDCMHIKHAYELSHLVEDRNWCFDETIIKDKGDTKLLTLCKILCNNSEVYHATIAIFDRDGSVNIKDIEDDDKGYKVWGNRVYSLALPIPVHRRTTPKISIEHYYSDSEIFREYEINGVSRRLYMGNEFDEIGRASTIGKMTKRFNKCGAKSIAIIDSDVYDISSSSMTNYALSKMKFAQKMCGATQISPEAMSAYSLLFSKILEILKYDAEHTD